MDKIFNKPFAVNGARAAIPENGTENERVSFDKGFTQPYEVEAPSIDNPNGQGFNILRPEMNEILNQLSNACNLLAENIDKWTALTTENLNDIKQAGRYFQNSNKNATNERNYPENIAGYLIVLNNSINSYGVTQIYKIWNSEKIYIRKTTSATAWSNWDSLVLTSEFNNKITSLQNTDTNLNNNKEDKTYYSLQYNPTLNAVKDNRFYAHGMNYANAFNKQTNYIFNIGAENGDWVRQISFPCASNEIGVRRITTKNNMNSWSNWDSLVLTSEFNNKITSLQNTDTNLNNNKEDKTKITFERIPDGANLNNYTTQGFYCLQSIANVGENFPERNAGYLFVFKRGGTDNYYQIYYLYNSTAIYIRNSESGSWTSWKKIALWNNTEATYRKIADSYTKTETNNFLNQKEDKTKFTNSIINATTNSNLDNLTQNGFYWRTTSAGSPLPTTNGGAVIVNTNGSEVIQYFYTDMWNSSTGGAWFRTRNANGTWTGWHHLENSEHAEATYRKIADSYTKSQCDTTFLTIANANSTYRKIADSYTKSQVYTKSEVNTRTPSLVLSKIGFEYSNIQNATFTIPNNSFLKTCNIQIMFRIRQQANNEITFNFKNGNVIVASRKFTRSSVSSQDFDVCDYISGLASFNITSALLGKTITPEIVATNTGAWFLIHEVDLLITYGS